MKPGLANKTSQPPPASGATETLDSLCSEHLQKVKRWARRLAGPSADLEDLVHDIRATSSSWTRDRSMGNGGAFLVGDLNRDGKLDVIVSAVGAWRVLLNTCQ
jgi:hypothetical protein